MISKNKLLIFSVFIVASCGLAYELIMGALSSYLLGDSILQFSTIIGSYLFAMGVGAGLSKFVKDEKLVHLFIDIEIAISIIGGVSSLLLMMVFFYLSPSFKPSLYGLVFMVGLMVGMEIPIVMRILHKDGGEIKDMISNVLSFDYLGALFVSLMFPLVFMPYLGINRTAIAFGFANLAIGFLTLKNFSTSFSNKQINIRYLVMFVCASILTGLMYTSEKISNFAEKGIYGNEIIYSKNSKYQKLFVTKHKDDIRLFINGNLQFSTKDEHRYHEALVHPALAAHPIPRQVLILGGGDGLAAREVLKNKKVEKITLVDLDPEMTNIFKSNEMLKFINNNSLNNEKVKVINMDASKYLSESNDFYDVIIIDFPDPSNYALGKLYSTAFYELVKNHLSQNGYATIQSTSPYFAPRVYWTVFSTLKSVGFNVYPYHAYVPSFGDWGFFLITLKNYEIPKIKEDQYKYLTQSILNSMFDFPKDMPILNMEPNSLTNQNVVEHFNKDWSGLK